MSDEAENVEEVEGAEVMSQEEIIREHLSEIDAAFEEVGFLKRIGRMMKGLGSPRSSADYKLAKTELQRLIAPTLAILCPVIFIVVLCVVTDITGKSRETIQIDIARTQDDEALEEEAEQVEVEQQQEETEIDISVDTPDDMPTQVTDVVAPSLSAAPADQALKQPDPTSVSLVKSPVSMKSIYGETRSAASRMSAIKKYGGDARTEAAVINALRWLKTVQKPDGSWAGTTGADGQSVTGLAILTFLSHGEQSGGSEFGVCVSRGLEWLMSHRDNLDPVGTHALAEAYGFLKNPNLKEAATQAVRAMTDRICDTVWGPGDEKGLTTRPNLLRMAFQTMALKSAKMSGIQPPNLETALAKLKEGFMIQGNKKLGGFASDHYGPPGANYRRTGIWHFMVGVIGLQYLGAGDMPIVEKTMKILDDDWEDPTLGTIDSSCCPVRGNYWATMVFFNGGGKRWQNWNRKMIDIYFRGQTVLKGAYKDAQGNAKDMGYWQCEDMHIGAQPVVPTCWVALQLMVYYRYLPTSSKEARGVTSKPKVEEPKSAKPIVDVDVEVDI